MTRVVIAGISTRAAADSAARAGFAVVAIDGYADRDQHPAVRAIAVPRHPGEEFTAARAAAAGAAVDCDAVAYLSNFENNPGAVAALAGERALWGNPPDVLRRARDPFLVARTFRSAGFPAPRLWNDADNPAGPPARWLVKPLASGGGHAIHEWHPRNVVPRDHYVQEWIQAPPGSVIFIAAEGHASVLGVSRQLIGDPRFGAAGFRYCGNILASAADPQFASHGPLARAAARLAAVAAANLRLVGANGIDFIALNGVPYPIEINPRWSSSMELVERACGINVFAAHAAACTRGDLPAQPSAALPAVGKAVVFAREPVVIGDTDPWLRDPDIRDIPHRGEAIAAGSPVCTVLATADTAAACEFELARRADRIYTDLERWRRETFVSSIHDRRFPVHNS
jgi:predicted ATP-grasp superfamily ATP-dependent carboligase